MAPTLGLACLALASCGGDKDDTSTTPEAEPETAVWLETVDWGWELFNHRVSYLDFELEPLQAAIIGGTSTTNVGRDLDESCDPSSCREFPFLDNSHLELGWGAVTTTEASFAIGSAEALANAGGATTEIRVPAPDRDGTVTAVLRGFRADTDHPLDGDPACYDPSFGWHPTRIAVALADPRREGDDLVVDVTFTFGAGNTDDPDRLCIDEVNERALIPMWAEVLFVVGPDAEQQLIDQEAAFAFSGQASNPGEQIVPDALALTVAAGIRGWSRLDWTFNPGNPDGRGAYLRTLTARIDGDTAAGSSTNFSPVTQLHDFAFHFQGEITAVPLDGVTHQSVAVVLPAEVDADNRPVLQDLETAATE